MFNASFAGTSAAAEYARGIALIHAAWLFFFLCGTLVWTPALGAAPSARRPASEALLDIIVASATGMAIVGFVTFGLGLLHLLYPVTALALICGLFAVFVLLGDSPLRRAFWLTRWNALATAPSWGAVAVYAASLIFAMSAILPETASDALTYHLVYPLEWARAHWIFVDMWRRLPYYASNWLMLDIWFYELGVARYVDFLGWLAAALSLLGIYGLVQAVGSRAPRAGNVHVQAAAFFAAMALLFSPIFVRWANTGLVDVAIGCFFLVSVAGVVMSVATHERRWALAAIVCFPFLVGMKEVFIAFIPLALAAAWIGARATRFTRRAALGVATIALILCLPWYVKNFIQAGDPIAPILNLALHRPDPKWTPADMALQQRDLAVDNSPLALLRLPVDIILNPQSGNYRDLGVSLAMFAVFAPGIVLVYGLLRRSGVSTSPFVLLSAFTFFAIAFWLVTTHLARYALLFYAAFTAFLGIAALGAARRSAAFAVAGFLALACSALPAPAAVEWLAAVWDGDYKHVDITYKSRDSYLAQFLPDFAAEEYISQQLLRDRIADPRVYMAGVAAMDYYFAMHNVTGIGDWFGPERYDDFASAIDRGTAAQFLRSLHIDAIMLGPFRLLPPDRLRRLEAQLVAAGYHKRVIAGQPTQIFFARGVQG
jgi:4-amino-4-deoxy-L-arabinose transferase-like glycosyltransferase